MDRLNKLLALQEKDPNNSFLYFGIAKEYESLGNPEKANEWYRRLIAQDPNYTGVYYHSAKSLVSLNRKEDAINTIEQGIQICKDRNAQHDLAELSNLKMNILLGED